MGLFLRKWDIRDKDEKGEGKNGRYWVLWCGLEC